MVDRLNALSLQLKLTLCVKNAVFQQECKVYLFSSNMQFTVAFYNIYNCTCHAAHCVEYIEHIKCIAFC